MIDIIRDVLINTVTQLAFWIFPFFGLSLVMHKAAGQLQTMISRAFGYRAYMVLLGWPGTLVHELSHMLTGLVFRHKVESFKVNFRGAQGGQAGSVRLAHNPDSYFQKSGNFFIAVAPVFGGAVLIYLAGKFLVPDLLAVCAVKSGNHGAFAGKFLDHLTAINTILFQSLINQPKSTIIFLYIVASIGSGMRMSMTDMKKTIPGTLILIALFFICQLIGHTGEKTIHFPVVISDWALQV